jgi:hypothetical protein
MKQNNKYMKRQAGIEKRDYSESVRNQNSGNCHRKKMSLIKNPIRHQG